MCQLRRIGQLIAARLRDERGVSLIELLVAIPTAIAVVGGAVMFMIVSFHQQNAISSRALASNQAAAGLQQLTQDLREAFQPTGGSGVSVSTTGATTSISFQIPTPGSASTGQSVTWTCPSTAATSIGTCTRTLGTTTKIEINRVQSMAFTPYDASNPPVALSLPVTNSTTVSAVAMTLKVRITNYGLTSNGVNVTSAVAGTANSPIVLQATADLRNFT
jgi:Tfp pilus assembly protein PilW